MLSVGLKADRILPKLKPDREGCDGAGVLQGFFSVRKGCKMVCWTRIGAQNGSSEDAFGAGLMVIDKVQCENEWPHDSYVDEMPIDCRRVAKVYVRYWYLLPLCVGLECVQAILAQCR